MMNEKKITKAQKFAMLKAIPGVAENEMLVEFIDHEIELLAKKNSAEKKPTAQQTANASIADEIVSVLASNPTKMYTITDLIKEVPACAELTNQRVSAIVRQLLGVSVERVEDKRKAYFRYLAD
jgi:hypothetical protein